jgi:hypothetical protein
MTVGAGGASSIPRHDLHGGGTLGSARGGLPVAGGAALRRRTRRVDVVVPRRSRPPQSPSGYPRWRKPTALPAVQHSFSPRLVPPPQVAPGILSDPPPRRAAATDGELAAGAGESDAVPAPPDPHARWERPVGHQRGPRRAVDSFRLTQVALRVRPERLEQVLHLDAVVRPRRPRGLVTDVPARRRSITVRRARTSRYAWLHDTSSTPFWPRSTVPHGASSHRSRHAWARSGTLDPVHHRATATPPRARSGTPRRRHSAVPKRGAFGVHIRRPPPLPRPVRPTTGPQTGTFGSRFLTTVGAPLQHPDELDWRIE